MNKFCYSCGAPLWMEEFQGPIETMCKYCVDDKGELKPKDEIKVGIAEWLKVWQPDLDDANALKRADYYMKAMPVWAPDE